jgi:Xaa-Pro aminopeptidase
LPHAFMKRLCRDIGGVAFEDATEFLDRLRAIKSEEELTRIRATAQMQDEIFSRVLLSAKPGMRDIDVTSLAQREGQILGSEQGIFLGHSAPLGQRSGLLGRHFQARRIQEGDHLSLLIENNGPGGFYTEMARTLVFGKASQELLDGFAAVEEGQRHTLALLKPGASAKEVAVAHDEFMVSRGLPPETRLYCHGQGYDMVERPLVRHDESMRIETDMCLAVHPGHETASIFAVICDNYIVGASGVGSCLHATPKKIFEL